MTKFFSFFIHSNLYISFASTLLYFFYALALGKNFFLTTPLLVFALTFSGYHFVRFFPAIKGDPHSLFYKDWYEEHRFFLLMSMFVAIGVVAFGLIDLTIWQYMMLIGSLVITLLYEKVVFKQFSLRSLPFAKPFVIALAWTITCVGLITTEINDYLFFIDAFFLIFILCFVVDLQDKEVDELQGVKTFANSMGQKSSLSICLILFCAYLIYSWVYLNQNPIIIFIQLSLFILSLKFIDKKILFHYLIDGIIICKSLGFLWLNFS